METFDSDLFLFQSYSDLYGTTDSVQFGRRNGRVTPFFHPDSQCPDLSSGQEEELVPEPVEAVCIDLTPTERHTWLRLLDGRPIAEIAREDGVSREAIYCRIRGKHGRGGMVRKNPWVAVWWRRQKRNKHDQTR